MRHVCLQPFCMSADQTVSVDSPYFWNDAFALQHTASGQVACPAFLQPLAQGILSTGKSLLLLRAHQDHHRRSDCRQICTQLLMLQPFEKLLEIMCRSHKSCDVKYKHAVKSGISDQHTPY